MEIRNEKNFFFFLSFLKSGTLLVRWVCGGGGRTQRRKTPRRRSGGKWLLRQQVEGEVASSFEEVVLEAVDVGGGWEPIPTAPPALRHLNYRYRG